MMIAREIVRSCQDQEWSDIVSTNVIISCWGITNAFGNLFKRPMLWPIPLPGSWSWPVTLQLFRLLHSWHLTSWTPLIFTPAVDLDRGECCSPTLAREEKSSRELEEAQPEPIILTSHEKQQKYIQGDQKSCIGSEWIVLTPTTILMLLLSHVIILPAYIRKAS